MFKQEDPRIEVVYERCAGIDIHKKMVQVCCITPDAKGKRHKGLCCKKLKEDKDEHEVALFVQFKQPLRTAWQPLRLALSHLLLLHHAVALCVSCS